MGRILSIDYGKKRTGIAVTDPLKLIANGLVTVNTFKLFDYLKNYIKHEEVELIVIGRPLQLNGRPSENFQRVEQFVRQWVKQVPQIPITYYDERFTSVIAQQTILDSGIKKNTRRKEKGLVDEISATIILQDFMKYNKI